MKQRMFFVLCFLLAPLVLCEVSISQTQHFTFTDSTGDSYSIVIDSVILDGGEVENEDEIGVFTPEGICVGASALDGDFPIPLVAWRDDTQTQEIDGFVGGDSMFFRFWNDNEGAERKAVPHYTTGNGTFSYGSYSQLFLIVSSLGVRDPAGTRPHVPHLFQNYPNPFNMTTKIEYCLYASAHVNITIYNLKGQRIRILVDQTQSAGQKAITWDGAEEKGNEVASGIYFCKIKAGDFVDSKKMVILK